MVRVDVDKNKSISAKHAPDGNYIPRVYFLSSALQADLSIQAPRPSYKYFYDERSPGGDTPPGSFALSLEKAAQRLR